MMLMAMLMMGIAIINDEESHIAAASPFLVRATHLVTLSQVMKTALGEPRPHNLLDKNIQTHLQHRPWESDAN